MGRFLTVALILFALFTKLAGQTFTVTLTANPAEGGTVSGGGQYETGTPVTVTASAATGYVFVSWTENQTVVSSNPSYAFELTSDRTLVANFNQMSFSITTSVNPSGGGSTIGDGTYTYNSSVTVSATPAQGYTFVNWTESGSEVSTSNYYSFTATVNRNLVANFIQAYNLITLSSPSDGGSTTGGGIYNNGSSVTVIATPAAGYRFINWTEESSSVSTNAEYTFIATANRNLVANFVQTFSINTTSNPAFGGLTTGGGIYDSGAAATVIASPATGYRFVGWTEDGITVSTNPTYVFIVSGNRSFLANFIQVYIINTTSNPSTGGLSTGGGTYDIGMLVTVTATPNPGYKFVNWTEGGIPVTSNPAFSFAASVNRSLVANFIQTFNISTSSNPMAGGTATGSGTYDSGILVTVTASPAPGYGFVNWTESGSIVSTNAGYTFTVSTNRILVANFVQIFTITTSSSPVTGGSTTGGGTYNSGATVTVTASSASGYRFVNWTESGSIVSTSSGYTFTVVANGTLAANFVQVVSISSSSNPVAGGLTAGAGTYDLGASVTVTAIPASGYRFINWTEGGLPVSTSVNYAFQASVSRTLVANFIQTFNITTSSNPLAGGSVTGGGTYDSGSQVTVTATPSSGYRFVNWTEGGLPVSTNTSYAFTATANRTLVANFIQTFLVTISSNPATGGTTTGAGTYNSGTSVTVTATPSAGFRFVNWTEGGSSVSTNSTYTFTATSNHTLSANFVRTVIITILSSPVAGGSTTGSGTFDSGTSVTVIATPASGYRFANWSEGGSSVSTSDNYTFSASVDRNLTANFIRVFSIITSSSPTEGGSTSGSGIYDSGLSVTVLASPAPGYLFVNWTERGSPVSTNAGYTFTASANRDLAANFIKVFTIATSSNPTSGGSTNGGGTYNSGTLVTVTASANSGYRFVNWTDEGSFVSANPSYTFTASDSRALIANFIQFFSVSTSSNPAGSGSTSGGGTFDSGSSVTINAIPGTGYRFTNWTDGGSIVSTNSSYTFNLTGNRILAANFSRITCSVTTSSIPSAGGSTKGGGTFNYGSQVTVIATPVMGYRFLSWSESGSVVSTIQNYTFTVTANRILVASFTLVPVVLNLKDIDGNLFHNYDTIKLNTSDAGSFNISVESNFGWSVSENSLWLIATKENDTTLRINYLENISVIEKITSFTIKNQLNTEFHLNVLQKARISQLNHPSRFDNVKMYPNPAQNFVYFRFGNEEFEKISLSVTNVQGDLISTRELHNINPFEAIEVPLAELPVGHYLITISNSTCRKSFSLIKF